jgi:hypothetical protein
MLSSEAASWSSVLMRTMLGDAATTGRDRNWVARAAPERRARWETGRDANVATSRRSRNSVSPHPRL